MKEYKITKERLEAMAKKCPEAKEVLKEGFPEAFEEKKEEWVDVTSEIEWRVSGCGKKQYWLKGYYEGDEVVYWYASEGIHERTRPGFKLVINSNVFGVLQKNIMFKTAK